MPSLYKCSECKTQQSHDSDFAMAKAGWMRIELYAKGLVRYFVFCAACRPKWVGELTKYITATDEAAKKLAAEAKK